MKVLFDHQTFTLQEFGGISRYFYEINKQFRLNPDVEVTSSLLFSNNEYLRETDIIPFTPFFPGRKFKGKLRLMLAINTWQSLRVYKKQQFDIFHPTYYDPYYFNVKTAKPVVVTCLDLIHEKYIQDDVRTIANKKKVFERADKILAISENTKNDLIEYYKISPDKIVVTYLASAFTRKENVIDPNRFFLYVGARNLYKNFIPFVEAIAPLLLKHRDVYLYCAGGSKFNEEEKAVFANLKIDHKIQHHPGLDNHLQQLYSNAVALMYPSKYEGFGIPLVEAMGCGCPVGASNVSSLPEVGANAALYFDPSNKDEILGVAETFLNDPQMRNRLIENGYQRAKNFTWQNTAQLTHQTYKSML